MLCPTCQKRPRGRSKRSGLPLDYCDDCHRWRTIRAQRAFKRACVEYCGTLCHLCGCEAACDAALCFRDPLGSPRSPRVCSLTGAVPLTSRVKAILDRKVLACLNCERIHFRSSRFPSKLKQRLFEAAGGRCTSCGTRDPRVIDFHHRGGRGTPTKSFALSKPKASVSYAVLEAELQKCTPLCANCHACEHFLPLSGEGAPDKTGGCGGRTPP